MRKLIVICLSVALTFCVSNSISAQTACTLSDARATELTGVAAEYLRLGELADTGAITLKFARRLSDALPSRCTLGLWSPAMGYMREQKRGVGVLPLSVAAISNSAYPVDRNNGMLWGGRGLSTSLTAGLVLQAGPLSVAVNPELTYQANSEFTVLPPRAGNTQFGNGFYDSIDLPQRFGSGSYTAKGIGQSFARIDLPFVGVGVSNENLWWGPGISNSILFTNTAPGFPHVFVTSRRPLNVGIGHVSIDAIWGRTIESQYFDSNSANDLDLITAGLLTFEPRGTRGLILGFGRTFSFPWDSLSVNTATRFAQPFFAKSLATADNIHGTRVDDQRLSLMFRYVLPPSELELYGEWAREDASWDVTDFIQEPEHSVGRIFGIQKLFRRTNASFARFYAEVTDLQQLRQNRDGIRPTPSFYLHEPHGHTQRGQLLGASIGPGGESQLFGVDAFRKWGLIGAFFERVRRDEFSSTAIQAWSTAWPPRHDVEMTGGFRVTGHIAEVRVDGEFRNSRRRNRNFIRDETNRQVQLRFTWAPKIVFDMTALSGRRQ